MGQNNSTITSLFPNFPDGQPSYSTAPPMSFWECCSSDSEFRLGEIFQPRFLLNAGERIGAAGSCFAQKIGYELRQSNANLVDVEPKPHGMSHLTAAKLGFGIYSARYGNVYTTAQWLQLIEDAFSNRIREEAIWQINGRWYDGLRPRLEPGGFSSLDLCVAARQAHLSQVRCMFLDVSVFIFTLGLTERWENQETGTVFPICPEVINPAFGHRNHIFRNARIGQVVEELNQCISLLRKHNPLIRFIFTVSPVPLSATATGCHVLNATSRSKAVLRTSVDEICFQNQDCDYFPSYEIVTQNPKMRDSFNPDQRTVKNEVVDVIMNTFFSAYPALKRGVGAAMSEPATNCDEVLLAAVSR